MIREFAEGGTVDDGEVIGYSQGGLDLHPCIHAKAATFAERVLTKEQSDAWRSRLDEKPE